MAKKPRSLTLSNLCVEAKRFAEAESSFPEPSLYGVTDGKAVGTYFEHKFKAYLSEQYHYVAGNSASGIDFPELEVDMKVTSIRQPQSSCPYKSPRQKVFGLGYGLLVFVYEKTDDAQSRTGLLKVLHTVFIEQRRTADYQMTRGLLQILDNDGNVDDIIAYFTDRNLPIDEIEANTLATEVLSRRPEQGYLTISNALQWRLQYGRVLSMAGQVEGIKKLV